MADFIDGLLGYMKDPRRTQQMQGLAGLLTSANDRARAFNQLSRAATEESLQTKDIYGPKTQQLAQIMADAYNPVGMVSRVAPKSLDELAKKYPDVKIDAFVGKNDINLSRIVVPKEMRNQGIGTQVMEDLSAFADSLGKRVTLTPSSDFGGSVPKLKTFYKEFGFVENKGKNKDFSTSEAMYREPKPIPPSMNDDESLRSLLD
jgi:GNAT superfamily N-acetyltransferase